jgi:multidrug resistance efflux pump
MKLSVQTYIFLALIVVAFVAGFCSKGDNNFDKEIEVARRERDFHNRIADLNHRKENIARVGLAYRDSLEQLRLQFANREIKQEKKVKASKKRVDSLKVSLYNPECTAIIAAQDTVILELEGTIVILKEEKGATWNNFNEILKAEHEEKELLNAEVEEYKEQVLFSQADVNHFKKQQRKARRQRNLAILFGLVITGLAVTN